MLVVGPPRRCVGCGLVDQWVWSSGFCGFFFCYDRCLKEEVGMVELGMAKVGRGLWVSQAGVGLMSLWVSQVRLCWLGFESMWIVAGRGGLCGSGVEDRGGSVGLEFWVLWFFFFFWL